MGGANVPVAGMVLHASGVETGNHVRATLPSPPFPPSPFPVGPGEGQPVCDVAVSVGHHSPQGGAAPPTGGRPADQAEAEHCAEGGRGSEGRASVRGESERGVCDGEE